MLEKLMEIFEKVFTSLIPFVVVQPYEKGVLLRLGRFVRDLEPGFHWCFPFEIDIAHVINAVLKTHRIAGLATTTKDGVQVGFDAVVSYRIRDAQKAILDVDDVQDAILDSCAGIIGSTLADSTWEKLLHGEAIDNLTKVCRQRSWQYGVEIVSVQLTGVARVRTIRILSTHDPLPHQPK